MYKDINYILSESGETNHLLAISQFQFKYKIVVEIIINVKDILSWSVLKYKIEIIRESNSTSINFVCIFISS